MRTRAIGFGFAALFAPAIFGQTVQERQFHLTHPSSIQAFQEIVNAVRTVTEVRDVTSDNAQMSVTFRGTDEQVGLVEWLVKQLDQPAGTPALPVPPEYKGLSEDVRGQATHDGVARIFYLPHTMTVQNFQEAANATRTVTEIRRMFTYNDGRAVLARGTPEQMAMAEWMLSELDRASATPPSASQNAGPEFSRYSGISVSPNDELRVFYIPNTKTVQDFQEVANLVRTIARIRRVFTYNEPRAVAIRGTPIEMATAQWLVTELGKPADAVQSVPSDQYQVPGSTDDAIRVFYLRNAKSLQDFQATANAVRSATNTPWVFTNNARRALAVRGTGDQLALAERLAHDLDAPAK